MARALFIVVALSISGSAAAKGGLSTASAMKVAKSHEDDAQACYAAGKSRAADLAGRVALDLAIEPSGKVKRAHATPTPQYTDKASLACLEDAAKGWSFPSGSAPLSVTVAFTFGEPAAPPPSAPPIARRAPPPAPPPSPKRPAPSEAPTTKNTAPMNEAAAPLPPADAPPVDALPAEAAPATEAPPSGENPPTPPPQ